MTSTIIAERTIVGEWFTEQEGMFTYRIVTKETVKRVEYTQKGRKGVIHHCYDVLHSVSYREMENGNRSANYGEYQGGIENLPEWA
jgi:hypothetical protein